MDKINQDFITGLGETKYVSDPDENGFISKVFKTREQSLPIEEQKRLLDLKKIYFGEYIPETELVEIGDDYYFIKQKFIKGKTLAQTDVSNLSAKTLYQLIDFIKKYLKYFKEQGGDLDLTGYQFYEGNPNFLIRKIKNFLKINQNFLASTNIMIGDDGNVYMVDVCESSSTRLQGKIKNFCAKPFIKRTIFDLEKLLKDKINFENKISTRNYQ